MYLLRPLQHSPEKKKKKNSPKKTQQTLALTGFWLSLFLFACLCSGKKTNNEGTLLHFYYYSEAFRFLLQVVSGEVKETSLKKKIRILQLLINYSCIVFYLSYVDGIIVLIFQRFLLFSFSLIKFFFGTVMSFKLLCSVSWASESESRC